MPFSITTRDGITINGIPDDLAPDSDVLKQRVAAIRAKRDDGGQANGHIGTDTNIPSGAASAPEQQITGPKDLIGQGGVADFQKQRQQELLAAGVSPEIAQRESQRLAIDKIKSQATGGVIEAIGTIGSGIVAEPIAGIAGVAQSLNPLASEGAGSRAVEATREALTLSPGERGQEVLGAVGEAIEPVTKALSASEDLLGDKALEVTGSPALAAAAKTIPTALLEVIGISGVKGGLRGAKVPSKGKIARELNDAIPSIDQLKDTSRAVFKEIDDLGASMKPKVFEDLVVRINKVAKDSGIDPDITPKASKALRRFEERVGDTVNLTEIDTMRKVAQNAAKALEPAEQALGVSMIDTVDGFLDSVGKNGFTKATGEISKRYKVARDLWGRARRSELLQDAFEKARNQASGFENGVRSQLRSILNNKRQSRLFKKDELDAIKRVVRGGKGENLAKLVGRLGFSEGGATNIIGGALGATAGGVVGGAPGAVIVPLVGQLSRKLAQRMTAKNANFADQVIRAGKDAKKITKAYLKNTPKAQRSSQELSELLMRGDIDLATIPNVDIAKQAAELASNNRAALGAALAPGAQSPSEQQEVK